MTFFNALRQLDEDLHEHEFEDPHDEDHDDKPWGDVIAASLIIQAVTLSGLLVSVLMGYYGRIRGNKKDVLYFMSFKVIPSFACGALIATAVFLVIPESLVLLGGGHDEHGEEHEDEEHLEGEEGLRRFLEEDSHEDDGNSETEASWKFGAALLSGFLFPILLHVFFPAKEAILEEETKEAIEGEVAENVEEASNKSPDTEATEDTIETKTVDWTLALSILVGDFFHNFTDGVFVGTAFLLCSRDVGYTIVATTIYHELAQEIADFALLHHHCGLPVWKAVLFNFVSGFSVMIGALIILSFDMSDQAQGITLAIAAGIYIYIAACECVPRIQAVRQGPKDTMLFIAMFVLGAIPIGLVLLNHEHCEASHGDEHEDHQEDGDAVRRLFF
eukprot:scaffold12163_cov176-Amphora_coffeaeformis.AAC.19